MAYNRITEGMSRAEFDGIPFLVRTESVTNQGRRVILHEYLNSNRIFAEDIGEIPPRFAVEAFIQSDRTGERPINYIQKAERFRNALNVRLNKSVKLTLPTLGEVRVIALPYTESRSQTDVGIVSFTLNFARASGSIVAAVAPRRTSDLYQESDRARGLIETTATVFWERVIGTIRNINNRLTFLHDITSMSTDIQNKVRNNIQAGPFGELRTTIRNFITALPNLINQPARLFGTMITVIDDDIGMFQDLSNRLSITSAANNYSLSRDFTRSGSGLFDDMSGIRNNIPNVEDSTNISSFDKPFWPTTTVERIRRNNIRNSILDSFRLNWLLIVYEQAAAREYATNVEVENVRQELSQIYTEVVQTASEDLNSFISDLDVLEVVNNVRTITLEILEQKEQQTFNLTTVEYQLPSDVLSITYDLYAEELTSFSELENRADIIINLNPGLRPDLMSGEITVLQSRNV